MPNEGRLLTTDPDFIRVYVEVAGVVFRNEESEGTSRAMLRGGGDGAYSVGEETVMFEVEAGLLVGVMKDSG